MNNWYLCYALKFFIPHQDIKRLSPKILLLYDSKSMKNKILYSGTLVGAGPTRVSEKTMKYYIQIPWLEHQQPGEMKNKINEILYSDILVGAPTTRVSEKYKKIYIYSDTLVGAATTRVSEK